MASFLRHLTMPRNVTLTSITGHINELCRDLLRQTINLEWEFEGENGLFHSVVTFDKKSGRSCWICDTASRLAIDSIN